MSFVMQLVRNICILIPICIPTNMYLSCFLAAAANSTKLTEVRDVWDVDGGRQERRSQSVIFSLASFIPHPHWHFDTSAHSLSHAVFHDAG